MISIVIPLYNKAQSILQTLETVFDQSYHDYEIIVVDDGSTDGSAEIVESLNDPRIRLVRQPNGGVSAARNRGIAETRGEFIAFLDADDLWDPDYLATQYAMTQKYPECDVFATNYQFQDLNGKLTPTILRNLHIDGNNGIMDNYFEVASTSHPPLWTSAVMVRKEAIRAIGGFPVGIKSGEDLLTWARLACNGSIAYAFKPMATFVATGYELSDKPKRIPAEKDIVATELKKLLKTYNTAGLKRYISHWHKMRSSIYMRLRMRNKSIREALLGLRYNPKNYKLLAYILLNLLPSPLQPF